MTVIRVLIADDQEVVRQGLAGLLAYQKDLEIVGQAGDGKEACELAKSLKPDVILMDIRMPLCDGIAATEKILQENPEVKILVLTTFDEEALIIKALKAGASGYLLKDTKSDGIAQGIQTVYNGGLLLGPTVAGTVRSHLSSPRSAEAGADLTQKLGERKVDVLRLIGQGKTNSEIAETLHISEGTVKNYVSQIFERLNVRDRVQAALIAKQELL